MTVDDLGDAYERSGLVLVLGAGVSRKSDLPTWSELLAALAIEFIGPGGAALLDELKSQGFGAPAIASVLESHCPKGVSFADAVRDKLYADFPYYDASGTGAREESGFADYVARTNHTLAAVAALCARKHPHAQAFFANPRIHAIINFNFDAIFRKYVFARYGPLVRTTERASKSRIPDRISVYHLHGYLRFDAKLGQKDKESDKLVFTEQQYFDFTTDQLSLFTYTFLYLLREYPCLFIGLSMQDANLRRLLHHSYDERVNGHGEEGEADIAAGKSTRHFAILQQGSETSREAAERSLLRLGVQPLWVTDHAEIPGLLGKVYERDLCLWSDVFDSQADVPPS